MYNKSDSCNPSSAWIFLCCDSDDAMAGPRFDMIDAAVDIVLDVAVDEDPPDRCVDPLDVNDEDHPPGDDDDTATEGLDDMDMHRLPSLPLPILILLVSRMRFGMFGGRSLLRRLPPTRPPPAPDATTASASAIRAIGVGPSATSFCWSGFEPCPRGPFLAVLLFFLPPPNSENNFFFFLDDEVEEGETMMSPSILVVRSSCGERGVDWVFIVAAKGAVVDDDETGGTAVDVAPGTTSPGKGEVADTHDGRCRCRRFCPYLDNMLWQVC
mmetsp:Transcript_55389/g.134515  ORF Transcript_55389/g.134515 Transcript_55389/m.134515 type:complete len:269 (+) Transcript_55389:455-1261(+)